MKRRIVSFVMVLVLALGLCVPAMAATTETVEISYRAIKLNLNGKEIVPCDAKGNTVEPFIMNSNGTTYLPLRAIGQALGLDVAWDGAANTITLTSGGAVLTGSGASGSTKGSKSADITYRDIKVYLDGVKLDLRNSAGVVIEPFIMGGTTYLPLRVIGQALGIQVGWDSATNTVSLTAEENSGSDLERLIVAAQGLNGNFSPFFYDTVGGERVVELTQLELFSSDRGGAVVTEGIDGEVRSYKGKDYFYNGIADLDITENADGSVYYDITLRSGLRFSDGSAVTIDDVIFSLYVLLDPMYDGISTISEYPIEGLEEYRGGMEKRMDLILAAGPEGYRATKAYTEEQYNTFWNAFWAAGDEFCREIVDYCADYGYYGVKEAASAWGYSLPAGATVRDFFKAIVDEWGYDLSDEGINYEYAKSSITELLEKQLGSRAGEFTAGVLTSASASNISGIQKTGDNSLRIVTEYIDPLFIYELEFFVAPLHYYGSDALYDYDSDSFGFVKGDLSGIKAKSGKPMGGGAYSFRSFGKGEVMLAANAKYYKGCPKTPNICLMESVESDKIFHIMTGTADIAECEYSHDLVHTIKMANSNGELQGEDISAMAVDYRGYGYIGLSAKNVCIDTGKGEADWGSEASKNLRKAIATVLAVYREVSVDSYYGDGAKVIEYPISESSWAAPQKGDEGYEEAFSKDKNGKDIYTLRMSKEERYEAAKTAALGYFAAAGYTVDIRSGKILSAPKGAPMSVECLMPAGGVGDHPSFMILCEASNALEEMGFNLIITDITNTDEVFDAVNAGRADMFAMAWNSGRDPDMYQIYHSLGASNEKSYWIKDAELDALIEDARSSTDPAYRKAIYRECFDIIADWAVEVPVYQRYSGYNVFSSQFIDVSTVTPDQSPFWSWTRDIEKLKMK